MSKEWFFPTAFSHWGEEENEAISRVIASRQFTQGQEVEAFESEFAAYHKIKHGIMVNSGSSANLIAIAALFQKKDNPLRRGDTAIVPAIAWSTTYAPLVQLGLNLMIADCDATWCMAPTDVAEARLVIGCSILGNPAPLDFLNIAAAAVDGNGCYFVEDNCESLGAWHGNKLCGTYGVMNTFSFYYSHQISAIEGGMILTNDDECARLCRILRAHGWSRDVQKPAGFHEEYNFTHFGYNVRALELHAAIGREQLKKLKSFINHRKENLSHFRRMMDGLPVTMPRYRGEPSPFGIHFTVADTNTRTRLVQELRLAGVDCRLPTGGSFRKHPYGRRWSGCETPCADAIHDCGLFIGNAPFDIKDRINTAVSVIERTLV